jgi:hypothetical protein
MLTRCTLVGLLVLLASGTASAGPLPLSWSFRSPTNTVALPDGVTGGFSFPNTVFEPGGWDAPAAVSTVASYSVASAEAPDRVADLPYQFAVELRDDASGETARFTFSGALSGTLWRTGSELSNRFTGATTQTAELGGHTYVIELDGFTPPGGYGDAAAGEITARVSLAVTSVDPPPVDSVVETPEPGTLLIGGAALAAGGFAALRRRRARG